MQGLLITFEGPDGSGKSTHIRMLAEALHTCGLQVVQTREPGGCPISEQIRHILLDRANTDMLPMTEALLYAAARAQHVGSVIRPALQSGQIVLCDRFLESSIAYQGYGRGLGEPLVRQINDPATQGVRPNATFFMNVPAEQSLRRLTNKRCDRLEAEDMAFHQRVFAGFEAMAAREDSGFIIIDATRTKEQVHQDILTHVLRLLDAR